jgi:hypothetical protein
LRPGDPAIRGDHELAAIESAIAWVGFSRAGERVIDSKGSGLSVGEADAPLDFDSVTRDNLFRYDLVLVGIDFHFVNAKACGLRLDAPIGTAKGAGRHDTRSLRTDDETVATVSNPTNPDARIDPVLLART